MADWQLAFQFGLIATSFLIVLIANSIKSEMGFIPSIFKSILYIGALGLSMFAIGSLKEILAESSIVNATLDGVVDSSVILITGLFYFLVVALFILSILYYIKRAADGGSTKSEGDYNKY